MAVSQRSPSSGGGAVALVRAVALCLLLLGHTDNVVEAKKVKRVKAGTTYKTHDRKSVKHILGTRFFFYAPNEPTEVVWLGGYWHAKRAWKFTEVFRCISSCGCGRLAGIVQLVENCAGTKNKGVTRVWMRSGGSGVGLPGTVAHSWATHLAASGICYNRTPSADQNARNGTNRHSNRGHMKKWHILCWFLVICGFPPTTSSPAFLRSIAENSFVCS